MLWTWSAAPLDWVTGTCRRSCSWASLLGRLDTKLAKRSRSVVIVDAPAVLDDAAAACSSGPPRFTQDINESICTCTYGGKEPIVLKPTSQDKACHVSSRKKQCRHFFFSAGGYCISIRYNSRRHVVTIASRCWMYDLIMLGTAAWLYIRTIETCTSLALPGVADRPTAPLCGLPAALSRNEASSDCSTALSCSRRALSESARSSARAIFAICASYTSTRVPASACTEAHTLASRGHEISNLYYLYTRWSIQDHRDGPPWHGPGWSMPQPNSLRHGPPHQGSRCR